MASEELEEQLKAEPEVSVMEINQQINAAETQTDLNKLTEEIKNGNYSEADKADLRKIFKQKKASLLQKNNNEELYENI